MPRAILAVLILLAGLGLLPAADAQSQRQTPYWASISSSQALMRTGPGRNYPGRWLYVRPDLPVRVLRVHQDWREVEDPDGTTGWMFVRLLSDTRTAIVKGEEPRPMHERPDASAPVRFRAEPGVVGRVSRCAGGWCRLEVGERSGFIRADHIWGVDAAENLG